MIERALMIEATDIEKLCDFSTWAGAGLMWHGAVPHNILSRGHKMQISASFHTYAAPTARSITRLGRTS